MQKYSNDTLNSLYPMVSHQIVQYHIISCHTLHQMCKPHQAPLEVLNAGSLVYVPGGRFHILHALPADVDAKTAEMVPGHIHSGFI